MSLNLIRVMLPLMGVFINFRLTLSHFFSLSFSLNSDVQLYISNNLGFITHSQHCVCLKRRTPALSGLETRNYSLFGSLLGLLAHVCLTPNSA